MYWVSGILILVQTHFGNPKPPAINCIGEAAVPVMLLLLLALPLVAQAFQGSVVRGGPVAVVFLPACQGE